MKKFVSCFLIILCIVVFPAPIVNAAGFALPEEKQLTASAVYLVNLDTGIPVYVQDAFTPRSVASLTKLMTALLLIESTPDLAGTMITAESSLYVSPITDSNSSHADIRPNEQVRALDMLYAMMLPSANEAAEAVGYYLGNGNLNNFYALMNARAAELGCTSTNFASTNGLVEMDGGNYSCAYDMYLIANACWQYEIFRTVVNTTDYDMPATNIHDAPYTIRTTNAMLRASSGVFRDYIRGVKTGSTEAAGRNFISAATNGNGESFLCVVLGCPYEPDANGYALSFSDTATLYDWVFNNFSVRPSLDVSTPITEIRVNYSTDLDTLKLFPASDLKTILPTGGESALEQTFALPESIDAPIAVGDIIGTVTLSLSGEVIGTVDLLAGQDVSRNPLLYFFSKVKTFFSSLYFKVVLVLTILFIIGYIGLTIYLYQQRQQKRQQKKPVKKVTKKQPPPSSNVTRVPLDDDDVFFK